MDRWHRRFDFRSSLREMTIFRAATGDSDGAFQNGHDTLARRHWLATGVGAAAGLVLGGIYRQTSVSKSEPLVRPPGAGSEAEFLAACIRCGQCVLACPEDFDTLRLADLSHGLSAGTPYADDLRERPCTLCQGHDELQCIKACPTNALRPVADLRDIAMGKAVINEQLCWAYNGILCKACWHACPWPNEALKLDLRLRAVVEPQVCVGCGLCVRACPTDPSSIVVEPAM